MAVAHLQSNVDAPVGNNTTIAVAFGSNVASGSVLLAFVSWDYSNSVNLNPTCADSRGNGWSRIGSTLTDDTSTQRMAAFWAPSGSAGADTVTVTFPLGAEGARRMVIAEYSGATAPVVEIASTQKGTGATGANGFVDGSLTPNFANSMVVSSVDCTQAQASIAAGTGWTERVEASDHSIQLQDALQTTRAAITAMWTCGTATRFNAYSVVVMDAAAPYVGYIDSTATNFVSPNDAVASRPVGTLDGDLLIAWVYCHSSISVTPPGGWESVDAWNPNFGWFEIFRKIAASEPATSTFVLSSHGDNGQCGMVAYRNLIWDVYSGQEGFSGGTTPETPAIIPSFDNSVILGLFNCSHTGTISSATPDTSPVATEREENSEFASASFVYLEEYAQTTRASVSLGCISNGVSSGVWSASAISLAPEQGTFPHFSTSYIGAIGP